jgi:predicted phosphoadenosine phosphosulfate sulfurtransferase
MKQKILQYIAKWEQQGYPQGIPDHADSRLEAIGKCPSYRKICVAILKNDTALASLGYERPQTAAYMALKKIEIEGRK